MATAYAGYLLPMDVNDLLLHLGDDHVEPDQLPLDLRGLVDEAWLRGLVVEDCRGRVARS